MTARAFHREVPRECRLIIVFIVATVKYENRVRSGQGRGKPNEAWCVPVHGCLRRANRREVKHYVENI